MLHLQWNTKGQVLATKQSCVPLVTFQPHFQHIKNQNTISTKKGERIPRRSRQGVVYSFSKAAVRN